MALTIAGFAGRRILDGTSKDFPANAAGASGSSIRQVRSPPAS
jgi:hypothetical protein